MKTRFAIALAGALGLTLVIRAAMHYANNDPIALGVSALMGLVLVMGLSELWYIAGQNATLNRELGALNPETLGNDLPRLSPLLRALIVARLERSPLPVPTPVFAPYLVGLLVMLGLLGTFMGLFETLRGAGSALTASTEVADLRGGLQQSMQGLMRSFGTSAVGVATSAVLGLSAVFCRRSSQLLTVRLHTLGYGISVPFGGPGHPLNAMQNAPGQGLDAAILQELSRSLEQVSALSDRNEQAIDALGERFEQAHSRALQEQSEVLRQAFTAMVERIEQGVAETAERGLATLSDFTRDADSRELARGREAAELTKRIGDELSATTGVIRERLTETLRHDEAQAERAQALFTQLETYVRALSAQGRAQLEQIERFASDSQARQRSDESEAQERLDRLFERMSEALQRQAEQLAGYEATLIESRKEREQWTSERDAEVASQLAAFGEKLEQQHATAAAAMVEQLGTASAELAQRVLALGQEVMQTETQLLSKHEALAGQVETQASAQLDRFNEMQAQLALEHLERAEALATLFTEQVGMLAEKLEHSSTLVSEAAELVKSGGAELVTVAETFGVAAEQQRRAATQWLESLGDIERLVTEAGETAAADVLGQHLARTHEVFDRQLRFQQELIAQLHAGTRRPTAQEQSVDATA